jgi:Short C-terminal domain
LTDIEVLYRTKPSDITPRKGVLRLDEVGIGFWRKGKKQRMHYPWDTIRRFAFDDPGRTKANAGAIAMFGIAGMAGRKAFTFVTVGTNSGDVIFEADRPISTWRSMAQQLVADLPQLTRKLYIDGNLVGGATAVTEDLSTQITKLAELHAAGTLSDEEFAQAKQRLLSESS